jgi:general secretion pathway protein J
MNCWPASRRGFTLIELLVAMVLFAIMGVMAYVGYQNAARFAIASADDMTRIREVQLAVHTLVADFEQLAPRPVREPIGDAFQPALLSDRRTQEIATLTRDGWPNPAGAPRGTLQRVSYVLENGILIRQYTTVLDATLANAPVRRELLHDVERMELRFLGPSQEWSDQWPPLQAPPDVALRQRPTAVEITLQLKDLGEIKRLIEVPG